MSTSPGAPTRPSLPDAGGRGKAPPPRPFIPAWAWWVLLAVSLLWNAYRIVAPAQPPTLALSYSAFLQEVRAGDVASVTMKGQNIDGTFTNALLAPIPSARSLSSRMVGPWG